MDKEKVEEVAKGFWNRLIESDSKESSKRFLAVYVVVFLGTIITVWSMWKGVDFIILLGTWLGFAATLLGLSVYQANRKKKHDADVKKEGIKAAPSEEPIL